MSGRDVPILDRFRPAGSAGPWETDTSKIQVGVPYEAVWRSDHAFERMRELEILSISLVRDPLPGYEIHVLPRDRT